MNEPVLLVIDVGNTNVALGVYDYQNGESALSHHWRVSTHREQTSDELVITLSSLFATEGRKTNEITDVILSSVVPPVVPVLAIASICALIGHVGAGIGKRQPDVVACG